jgi:hypothetical protein
MTKDFMKIETLINDLDGDYVNYSVSFVVDLLLLEVNDRGIFYEKWLENKKEILTPKEYILKQCDTDQTEYPDREDIPQILIDRLNVLEGLIFELRYALENKFMPEEIYVLLKRFKKEGGIGQIPEIPELEI